MQVQTLDRVRLVKWELKVGNEPDMRLEEDSLRNRSGPEIEDWRDGDGDGAHRKDSLTPSLQMKSTMG